MMQTKMMNEGELVRLESRLLLKLDDAQRNTDKYVNISFSFCLPIVIEKI